MSVKIIIFQCGLTNVRPIRQLIRHQLAVIDKILKLLVLSYDSNFNFQNNINDI